MIKYSWTIIVSQNKMEKMREICIQTLEIFSIYNLDVLIF